MMASTCGGPSLKTGATGLIMDRIIFGSWWFRGLDRWVDVDWGRRIEIGKTVFAAVFVPAVVLMWLFQILDAGEL